jgi:hypothetical protein
MYYLPTNTHTHRPLWRLLLQQQQKPKLLPVLVKVCVRQMQQGQCPALQWVGRMLCQHRQSLTLQSYIPQDQRLNKQQKGMYMR